MTVLNVCFACVVLLFDEIAGVADVCDSFLCVDG